MKRSRAALGAEATRETAKSSLQDSARALAEQRYREARETVDSAEASRAARRGKGSAARNARREQRRRRAAHGRQAGRKAGAARAPQTPAPPSPERYRRAKELLAHVDHNQSRLGERWSDRDLQRFEAEDHELLRSSRDPADHAHRAGYERTQFEALQGPERERAEQQIEKARKRDSQRMAVASEVPGRIVGRRRQVAERVRQGVEELGGATERPPRAVAAPASGAAQPRSPCAAAQPEPGRLGVLLRRSACASLSSAPPAAALLAAAIGFAGGAQPPSAPRRASSEGRVRSQRQRQHRARRRGLRATLGTRGAPLSRAFFRYEVGELGPGVRRELRATATPGFAAELLGDPPRAPGADRGAGRGAGAAVRSPSPRSRRRGR